jgi:hypothetical protein
MQPENTDGTTIHTENTDGGAPTPAQRRRYPVLGQVRTFPGLFAGTLAADDHGCDEAFPSGCGARRVHYGRAGRGLACCRSRAGIGVEWDGEVPWRQAQHLQPAGFARLIAPFATGLAAGSEPMAPA